MTAPVIMWFRQDLRIADHQALRSAAAAGPLLCLFVLDDVTPCEWRLGGASRWWLHHSLNSLSADLGKLGLKLTLRRGRSDAVIDEICREVGAKAIYFSRDYSPWAGDLERRVKRNADAQGVQCHRHGGYLLHEPEMVRTGGGGVYQVYTAFARACRALGDPRPPVGEPAAASGWAGTTASDRAEDWALLPLKPDWASRFGEIWNPGEAGAQARLHAFVEGALAGYADGRDHPWIDTTSRLSPHLHWGEVSPIQCWNAVRNAMAAAGGRIDGPGDKFLDEILWREFCHHLLHHAPELPREPFRADFAKFPWRADGEGLAAWQQGRTGYPIVDAGMRELWITGYMHNRVRMITASFLTKHLLVSWLEGERWFWDTLVDADIANNTMNWQWVAGCGADAAPYFRIFNPVLQGRKFDPRGEYTKRWIPELESMPEEYLHQPWLAPEQALKQAGLTLGSMYPAPIVEHGAARNRALSALKQVGRR